ncbi:MAG: hypothetical protein ACKO0M_16485 [Cyanobium sp.]
MTRLPHARMLCGAALALSLTGCLSAPGTDDTRQRAIEFVQGRPGAEGLMFRLPPGFRPVARGVLPGGMPFQTYLPAGEPERSRRRFLEVIITPAAVLSARGVVTPQQILLMTAVGMRDQTCPRTFNASMLGPIRSALGPRNAPAPRPDAPDFAAILGCGRTPNGGSEVTLMVALRDRGDLFLLSWQERGAVRDRGPVPIDEALWLSRLRQLQPLRLCAAATGASGPAPDCVLQAADPIPEGPGATRP